MLRFFMLPLLCLGAWAQTSWQAQVEFEHFAHPPHGIADGFAAQSAQLRLRGQRVVLEAEGPSSKEGPYLALRCSFPLALLLEPSYEGDEVWVLYQHGGESGLEDLAVQGCAAQLECRWEEERLTIGFDLELEVLGSLAYPLESQRLQGSCLVQEATELCTRAQQGAGLPLDPSQFAEIAAELGRRGPFEVRARGDTCWALLSSGPERWGLVVAPGMRASPTPLPVRHTDPGILVGFGEALVRHHLGAPSELEGDNWRYPERLGPGYHSFQRVLVVEFVDGVVAVAEERQEPIGCIIIEERE